MERTPLYTAHSTLGATFAELHEGWEIVAHFSDPITEHGSVRKTVGIVDLSHHGRFWLHGTDRAKFLHRINSNNVEGLKNGDGNYAILLTNRGKIISDMKVCAFENAIGIMTNAETRKVLFKELDKYIMADDVLLEDRSAEIGTIAVHGPCSSDLVRMVLGIDVSGLEDYHSISHEVAGRELTCFGTSETGENGYELCVATESMEWLWNILLTKGRNFGAQPIGLTALNSLRIEAGIPRYGAELDNSVMPLEAELEHAIDFEKGCYIGQEIVARMKYRGHPNRLLRGLEIDSDTPPAHRDLILSDDKEVGWITSAVDSPTLRKTIALGYVRMAFTNPGSKVRIDNANERVDATIVSLPFYSSTSSQMPG